MNELEKIEAKDPHQPAPVGGAAPAKKGSANVNLDLGAMMRKLFGNRFLRVPLQERILFARHLSVGIKAGMSLQDSLKLIQSQTKSSDFKLILTTIIADTANGMFLSASMEKYDHVFGQLFINIVRVGEQSGTLTENLTYLAKELKKKHELRTKVRGALIYPAVIFTATIGIVTTLMVAVFPKILPVFSSLRIDLPVTTRILIAVTNFMTAYTFLIIAVVIALIIALSILMRYEWFKNRWHAMLFKLPVIGKIVVKVNMASISRILGLLLKSGTQIIEGVNITADALDNRVYSREMRAAGETLRRGEFFSIYLAKHPEIFPPIFSNMVQVGENTGNLTDNLEYLSTFYEEDVDEVLKNLNSIIEPFLLLFMGLLVGFMALSVVTPIYSISQTLTL